MLNANTASSGKDRSQFPTETAKKSHLLLLLAFTIPSASFFPIFVSFGGISSIPEDDFVDDISSLARFITAAQSSPPDLIP